MKRNVEIGFLGVFPSGQSPDPSDVSIMSLAFIIKLHGSDEFEFETMDGSKAWVSFAEYRNLNPEHVFLTVVVRTEFDSKEEEDESFAKFSALRGNTQKRP